MTQTPTSEENFRLVRVDWVDIVDYGESWLNASEDDEFPVPLPVRTVGWLIKESIEFITVASTIGHGEGHVLQFSNITAIPRGVIEDMEFLT